MSNTKIDRNQLRGNHYQATEAEISAITDVMNGDTVYNTTTSKNMVREGNTWKEVFSQTPGSTSVDFSNKQVIATSVDASSGDFDTLQVGGRSVTTLRSYDYLGDGSDGNPGTITNATLDGEKQYTNVTISSGTITIGPRNFLIMRVNDTLTINGVSVIDGAGKVTLDSTVMFTEVRKGIGGGAPYSGGSRGGAGGTGGVGIYIFTPNAVFSGGAGGAGGAGGQGSYGGGNGAGAGGSGSVGGKTQHNSGLFFLTDSTLTSVDASLLKQFSVPAIGGVGAPGGGGGGGGGYGGGSDSGAGGSGGGSFYSAGGAVIASYGGYYSGGGGAGKWAGGGGGGGAKHNQSGSTGGDGSTTIPAGGASVLIVCNKLSILSGSLTINTNGISGGNGGDGGSANALGGGGGGGGGGGAGGGGGGFNGFYYKSLLSGSLLNIVQNSDGGTGGSGGSGGGGSYAGTSGNSGSAGINGYKELLPIS